jgi:flavin reductase (DIM6/NTAB) family NADH-FMN oxidoreductase RutF
MAPRPEEASVEVRSEPVPAVADTQQLRRTFGTFATGVTVVTVGGATPHGMTANSFTSVSLDPPLVLVCVERGAIMHAALTDTGRFAISVLAADQERVARHFADRRRPLGLSQFDPVDCLPAELCDAPLIAGAAAYLECELRRTYDGGDHTIFLASVLRLGPRSEADVLVFLHGKFGTLGRARSELTA